ncbi:MAG: glycosyltransferase family 9 protein [Planctomycetota bacterium]
MPRNEEKIRLEKYRYTNLYDKKRTVKMNFLIFAPNHIGDAVMSTPLIATLKKNYPQSLVVVFARKNVRDIFTPFPYLDYLFEYDKSIRNTLKKIKDIEFDYSFCLASSFKVALISKIKGVKNIVGYGRNWRSPLLTHRVKFYRHKPEYIVDFYMKLLQFIEIKEWDKNLQLFVDSESEAKIRNYLESYGIKIGMDKIGCILPGYSGYPHHNAKMWLSEYFAKIGEFLFSNGFKTFIVVGPKEEQLAKDIYSFYNKLIPLINPALTIREVKAFLKFIDVFISLDSGLRYIARSFKKRGVTIYGPITPLWSLPINSSDDTFEIPLYLNLGCSPCYLHNCPIAGHPCTSLITPKLVIEKLEQIIKT